MKKIAFSGKYTSNKILLPKFALKLNQFKEIIFQKELLYQFFIIFEISFGDNSC